MTRTSILSRRDAGLRPTGRGQAGWPRRAVWLGAVGWTVVVGVVLWWLFREQPGPSVWLIGQTTAPHPAVAERFRAVFQGDMGIQRLYAWVLFGPYVAWVAAWFPLERGRLRVSLPCNLVMCAAFVLASHAISSRLRTSLADVTIIRAAPAHAGSDTNTVQVQVFHADRRHPLPEPGLESWVLGASPEAKGISGRPLLEDRLTNLAGFLPPGIKAPPGTANLNLWTTLLDLLAYGAVAGLAHSVHFYRRFRERERRTLVLESNLANARLHTLRAQLQPHFLFNSLNAIVTLLRRDPAAAEATLLSLSELLRVALSQSERQQVPLRDEVEFVQRYVETQQARFGDQLRFEQAVEPDALDCRVPTLLLQPLVENAIRHGLEPAETNGLVRLTAQRQDQRLVVTVEDDGVGLPNADLGAAAAPQPALDPHSTPSGTAPFRPAEGTPPPEDRHGSGDRGPAPASAGGTGIGLTNLRARLQTLYGAEQSLELVPRPGGGVTVRIELPWHPAPATEPAESPSQTFSRS